MKQVQERRHRYQPRRPDRDYVAEAIMRASAPWRSLLRDFAQWLEEEGGLMPSSVAVRIASTKSFLEAIGEGDRVGIDAVRRIDAGRVEDFFVAYCGDHGPGARRNMQAAMRHLIRYAAVRGWIEQDLAAAVPRLRSYKLSSVPRGVSDEDVSRLLRLLLDGKISARDQAFVLLLACYGVRQGHVAALRLDDIDWRARRITFQPHKRGKAIQHGMTPAVAVALARYLRDERPASESSCIFLRKHAPYYPVAPARVGGVVRKLFRRLGVQGPCGPHALRHAFATRLLRAGQPLKVIADLLGHRSLNSTCIYAKVDHPRLLEVAMDWPEVSP